MNIIYHYLCGTTENFNTKEKIEEMSKYMTIDEEKDLYGLFNV